MNADDVTQIMGDMLIGAEQELSSTKEDLLALSEKISSIEAKIEELKNIPAQSSVAASITALRSKGSKSKLSITVTGRDSEERIQSIRIEN